MESEQLLHILAVPFPAQSHISALMHLCKRIAACRPRQVAITFVNVDSIHEQMALRWSAPDHGLHIRLASVPFPWNIPSGYDAYCAANNGLFADTLEKLLPRLLKSLAAIQATPVRCILSDYFLPATQHVADELGVPRVAFLSGNASWASIEFHIPELSARKHVFAQDQPDCLIDYIGGLPPILKSDLPAYLQKYTDELWIERAQTRSPSIRRAAWVLVNSFYPLESQPFDFMRAQLGEKFLPVGPLSSSGDAKTRTSESNTDTALRAEDADCLAWLSTKPKSSVLYISFGSIAVLTQAQFWELAGALDSCRDVPFLWVVRPQLVIGGLDDESFTAFCRSVGDRGRVISWAPQLQVLKHPSTGGFLTHCGWNSMLESISSGVPMLGWPWAGEQNTNCRLMVDEWKIGAELPRR
ncbi:7-deoxyloganetin glucosyltransferase [Selaginella moellendorffii]|uniref:7-deoxyloganetin glucosyltransferase n=1 Tax=Selaginella moellendorffii TaxID=88036 RepID=UPI000D1C79D3|nr:7-deoxyloganetin glucosyltransferase [Selaginella moellendorffii]|eukprot:XP_002974827.2 7-deoxyloganetin glucosyltransferase [Selaginella moellendorffii]